MLSTGLATPPPSNATFTHSPNGQYVQFTSPIFLPERMGTIAMAGPNASSCIRRIDAGSGCSVTLSAGLQSAICREVVERTNHSGQGGA